MRLHEQARIAVGGVLQVVVKARVEAIDAAARVVVHGRGHGAAEDFYVAHVAAHADGPVKLVGGVVRVLEVVEILRPAAAVGVDADGAVAVASVRHAAFIVRSIRSHGRADLLEVACAGDGERLVAGFRQRGEEHGGQDRDDCDDHQEFNQRELNQFLAFHGFFSL